MIYVLSGGQTGATLTVTSSGAGTITVSNTTLEKSYSKSVTAGGSAVFKGLATGTWTVKLTDGTQTSTKTITITSDYSTSIAYFSATISITYPATSTCVVTNSGGQTVASDTNTGTSTKTWTATVNATGTYTVTATATDGSGKSKSQSVSITADGQSESVSLAYEFVLFDNGSYASVTGGWTDIQDNTLYKSVYGTSQYDDTIGYLSTVNSVNLLDYSTLYFVVSSYSSNNGLTIGVSPTKGTANDFSASYKFDNGKESETETVYPVDISSVSSGYIKARLVGYNGGTASIRIKKVYAV